MFLQAFRIVFVVLLGVSLSHGATEKIQLEDIERDNLISEQRQKANEGLEAQQTQHLRPPGIQPPNSFHSVSLKEKGDFPSIASSLLTFRCLAGNWRRHLCQWTTS